MRILIGLLLLCLPLLLLCFPGGAAAQPSLPAPQPSPRAVSGQSVGVTDISIVYHRPGVKGRQIWGGLVSYGEVWRAGANENTTISFATPVRIEGHPLPAGTYGLHMIPGPDRWTVILSRNATSWGSFFYKESEDALRVSVTPVAAPHEEWLAYRFDDLTDSSAVISLVWEKLRIPFRVSTDVRELVLQNAREVYLRGPAAFAWQGWNQAAAYCLQYGVNLDEALTWVDRSISMNENFSNLRVKAGLLEKKGQREMAEKLNERSMQFATEADLNALAYQNLQNNRMQEALELFRQNVRAHPESWNAYDSLGEALERSGNTGEALKNYRKALARVGDEAQKKRILEVVRRLEGR